MGREGGGGAERREGEGGKSLGLLQSGGPPVNKDIIIITCSK